MAPTIRTLYAALFVVAILAGSCAANEDQTADAASASTASEAVTTSPSPNTSGSLHAEDGQTATPAQVQLDWIVTVLNDDGQMTDADIEERFSPAFLEQVPADILIASIPPLFAAAEPPYTVESFETLEGEDEGDSENYSAGEAVLLGADGRRLYAEIAVATAAPNLIEWVSVTPTEPKEPLLATSINIDAIDDRLTELGPESSVGVYDVTNGDCATVHEIRTDQTIVLGSTFKLWVLAALAHEIAEGRAAWDEKVTITDELRSSPNGEIYKLETDAEVTLKQLAEAMISISDNTATDMLLDHLGREAVEMALERIGVADPSANVPMLSTGNLFALKYLPDEPNAADYRSLDEDGKRSMLADLDEATLPWVDSGGSIAELLAGTNADGVPFSEPRDLDIEWFATAEDLCRTLVHLSELAETPGLEPVASILEISQGGGLPFDRDRWPTIRFKGGSEPGVAAGAWWFEGPDGDRYVVAGGVANPDTAIDDLDAVLTLGSAIELIE